MYKQFCAKTGYAGTTKRAIEYNSGLNDTNIKVRFVANIDESLLWIFKPSITEIYTHPGETIKTSYVARNLTNNVTVGEATYNVTPLIMGKYFNKIQCFCFTKISINAFKEETLPIVFYIDSRTKTDETTKNIKTVTLTYNMGPPL
ncbi:cytochrome c oxidase assembly protein [Candidatus Hodgkinia cicadicola]